MRNNPRNTSNVDFSESRRGEDRRNTRRWVRSGKAAFLLNSDSRF
jgi:hypothetical protein